MRWLVALLALVASPAAAQSALPTFEVCLDIALDRFETKLAIHRGQPLMEVPDGLWQVRGVDYCGGVGIVRCDRGADPIACQHDLKDRQDALTARVVATLPAPQSIVAAPESWEKRLYDQTFALSTGKSAGDDCAGSNDLLTAWCEAREANRRLQNAVLAWQVARYFRATPRATEAGWANPPPPIRPRPRP